MANDLIFRALKSNSKSLNLISRNLTELSKDVDKLLHVVIFRLNNNRLTALPVGLQCMQQLTELNLGNNSFEEMPPVLKNLYSLKKLHLFRNKISTLPAEVLEGLSHLVVLNLNHNNIKIIPSAIKSLSNLERFSIANNQLEEIPAELGLISKMVEMDLSRNKLRAIPQEMYHLKYLRKLNLARNSLEEFPEGIHGWQNLRRLDVAGNLLVMFPVDPQFHIPQFRFLELEEFYFERNNLVRFELVTSAKEEEVLSLKELAARFVLKEHLNKSPAVSKSFGLLPDIKAMLSQFGRCAVCFDPFLSTWVECVQFINLCKDMRIKNSQNIPVRVLLCSYSCFNKSGHSYYCVAKVKSNELPSYTSTCLL